MATIVEFRDAGYAINGRALLERISFKVESGETIVLLGRSGSGKTTTLRLINRLLEPTSGEVLVEGRKTTDWDPIRLRRRIGYVIQEVGLFPHFTVERNVGLVPTLEGWPEAKKRERIREMPGHELDSVRNVPMREVIAFMDGEGHAPRVPRSDRRAGDNFSGRYARNAGSLGPHRARNTSARTRVLRGTAHVSGCPEYTCQSGRSWPCYL